MQYEHAGKHMQYEHAGGHMQYNHNTVLCMIVMMSARDTKNKIYVMQIHE